MQTHIETAPFELDFELAVSDGPHDLAFACRRRAGLIDAETRQRIDISPTHWREWKRVLAFARLAAAVTIVILFGASACFAEEDVLGPLQRDGLALAERMCAQCHAVGRLGASAHSGAPAFRELDRRIDLDVFTRQLREGLVSGHPDSRRFVSAVKTPAP